MSNEVSELQRIGCKIFFDPSVSIELDKVVPIFHRWIQSSAVEGMLIDVADYAHVPQGPGILLVAHEGNYAVDIGGGRPGMLYYSKQPIAGDVAQRLRRVCALALRAAVLLEGEASLNGAARVSGTALRLFANDRLRAPNSEATMAALRPAVDALLADLYPGMSCECSGAADPRERFTLDIKAPHPVAAATLLSRLG
jgi:hypothetical protein